MFFIFSYPCTKQKCSTKHLTPWTRAKKRDVSKFHMWPLQYHFVSWGVTSPNTPAVREGKNGSFWPAAQSRHTHHHTFRLRLFLPWLMCSCKVKCNLGMCLFIYADFCSTATPQHRIHKLIRNVYVAAARLVQFNPNWWIVLRVC